MTKEERLQKIEELKQQAASLKKEVDYYNALQLALKLVLNGSYGAFATPYFILYNNHVAGTITAEGRELTRTMDKVNQDYWYDQWHLDTEFHKKLGVKNVTQIGKDENVSIYGDTDSIFVSFKPCMDHCEWRNLIFNDNYLSFMDEKFIVLSKNELDITNSKCLGISNSIEDFQELLKTNYDGLIIAIYILLIRTPYILRGKMCIKKELPPCLPRRI